MRFITLTALCLALSGGVALADPPHRGHYSYGHRGWSGARSYHNAGYRSPRYSYGYNRGYSYGYNRGYRYPSYGYRRAYPYRPTVGFNVGVYPGYYRPTVGFNVGLGYPGYGYPGYGYRTYATGYAGSGSWVWDGYQWVWQPAVDGYIPPYGYDAYRY